MGAVTSDMKFTPSLMTRNKFKISPKLNNLIYGIKTHDLRSHASLSLCGFVGMRLSHDPNKIELSSRLISL